MIRTPTKKEEEKEEKEREKKKNELMREEKNKIKQERRQRQEHGKQGIKCIIISQPSYIDCFCILLVHMGIFFLITSPAANIMSKGKRVIASRIAR